MSIFVNQMSTHARPSLVIQGFLGRSCFPLLFFCVSFRFFLYFISNQIKLLWIDIPLVHHKSNWINLFMPFHTFLSFASRQCSRRHFLFTSSTRIIIISKSLLSCSPICFFRYCCIIIWLCCQEIQSHLSRFGLEFV